MARKVKETPVLSGRNAEIFERAIKGNKTKKVEQAVYDRAKAVYDRVSVSPPTIAKV